MQTSHGWQTKRRKVVSQWVWYAESRWKVFCGREPQRNSLYEPLFQSRSTSACFSKRQNPVIAVCTNSWERSHGRPLFGTEPSVVCAFPCKLFHTAVPERYTKETEDSRKIFWSEDQYPISTLWMRKKRSANLVPRLFHLTAPARREMKEPGNEVDKASGPSAEIADERTAVNKFPTGRSLLVLKHKNQITSEK